MEAAGIEPASASLSTTVSTCVVRDWSLVPRRFTDHRVGTSRVRRLPRSRHVHPRRVSVTSPIYRRPVAGLGPGRASGRATLGYAASAKLSLAAKVFPGVFRGSEHLGTLPRLPVHASKPCRPQFSRSCTTPRQRKPIGCHHRIHDSGARGSAQEARLAARVLADSAGRRAAVTF